jgi:hypothetical protein
MAARKSLKHDATSRQNIQTSQLLNRLNSHAIGEVDMTPTQVKAAEILLRKSLPDLSSTTLEAGEGMAKALAGIKVTFGS